MERSGVEIQFLFGDTPWEGEPAMTGCIYVPVEDADRALADLGISVEAPNGVEERPWGAREILLTDPNGYNLALVEEP